MRVVVHSAAIQDRDGAGLVLAHPDPVDREYTIAGGETLLPNVKRGPTAPLKRVVRLPLDRCN